MIRADAVAAVLRPWLGAAFIAGCDICERAAVLMSGFDSANGSLEGLAADLNALVFRTLRSGTRGDMRVLLDDGRVIRVRLDDVDQMADEALYLALRCLPRSAWQYARLRQFAMTHESLSALRALYVDFTSFQTEDELRLIARTARSCHPPYRWRGWLGEQD